MADPTKLMKLLEIAKKFGVKPSKVIGTQGNIVPFKKPSLVDISVDEFKLKESIDKGTITMDKVQQEMEETVRLALSKNLNDVELNRALNNAVNIDRQFFPPAADVYKLGVDEKLTGKGLEEVIQKKGRKYKPTSLAGEFETAGKKLEGITANLDEPSLDIGDVIKQAGRDQLSLTRMNDEGLVRATARQILSEDIKAGKIKSITLEDLGTMREPIEPFRKIYGEDALERLDSLIPDFNQLRTEQEAASLARSKFRFDPDETRAKGSMSYEELEKTIKGPEQTKEAKVSDFKAEATKRTSIDDLIDEYNANQDKLKLTDDEGGTLITYPEYNKLKDRNDEIAKALEEKGISSAIEEEVKTEGIVIPFRKKFTKPEPEDKAQGGIIGYALGGRTGYAEGTPMAGLVYVGSWEGPWTGPEFLGGPRKGQYYNQPGLTSITGPDGAIPRPGMPITTIQSPQQSETISTSEIPVTLTERYKKYLSASGSGTGDELYKSYRANLDKKAEGGRIGYAKGKKVMSSIDKLLEDMNKKLSKKKSMESVDPKTGEVTVPKKPIRKAEEPTGMTTMDPEPETIDERSITKTKSIMTIDNLKTKHKDAFEAHDQIFNVDINDKIAPDMIAESMAETKGKDYFSLSQKEQSDLYKKALAYVDDVRMIKKQKSTMVPTLEEFKKTSPETYGDFSKSTNRMQELLNFRRGQETFETFDLETYNYLNSQEIGRLLNQLKNPYKISDKERNLVRTGFTRENLEGTGLKNLDEINFRADKKQLETYLNDLYNKKQIEEAQIELSDLQDSGREPNANGGIAGLL